MEDLLRKLTETEGQKIEFEAGDQVLTDEQLDQLLDRSVSRSSFVTGRFGRSALITMID